MKDRNLSSQNDLTRHAESVKYKNLSAVGLKQPTLQKPFLKKRNTFHIKILLSVFIACHVSIRSVDHLPVIIKAYLHVTSFINKTIKLPRTKYTALIGKAIAPEII